MRKTRAVVGVALLAAALAACGGGAQPPMTIDQAFAGVMRSPLCSQNVPSDWNTSWPVPTGKRGEYAVLLYDLDETAQDASGVPRIRIVQPGGQAVFTLDGRVSACDSHPVGLAPLEGERYGNDAMNMEQDDFDDASRKLLSLTEAVGEAYARRAPVDRRKLAEFWSQFSLMAEPPLLADYYRLDPSFWEWLRDENGQSLPVAK